LDLGVRRALGYRSGPDCGPHAGPSAFGHVRSGGSFGYADPDRKFAIGFAQNYFTYATGSVGPAPRRAGQAVADALISAVGITRDPPNLTGRRRLADAGKVGSMTAANDTGVIRRGYDAFSRGDMDTIRNEVFAADIEWHQGGRNQTSGDFSGAEAVISLFGKIFQLTDGTFRVAVHDMIANDEHVVVLASFSGQRAGKSIESNYCQVFHMRDGRAAECWVTNVDPYAVDEFFA
jgi:ketosteroid isomerase-like protein